MVTGRSLRRAAGRGAPDGDVQRPRSGPRGGAVQDVGGRARPSPARGPPPAPPRSGGNRGAPISSRSCSAAASRADGLGIALGAAGQQPQRDVLEEVGERPPVVALGVRAECRARSARRRRRGRRGRGWRCRGCGGRRRRPRGRRPPRRAPGPRRTAPPRAARSPRTVASMPMFVSETLTARRSSERAAPGEPLLAEPLGLVEVALVLGDEREVGEQRRDARLVAEGLARSARLASYAARAWSGCPCWEARVPRRCSTRARPASSPTSVNACLGGGQLALRLGVPPLLAGQLGLRRPGPRDAGGVGDHPRPRPRARAPRPPRRPPSRPRTSSDSASCEQHAVALLRLDQREHLLEVGDGGLVGVRRPARPPRPRPR